MKIMAEMTGMVLEHKAEKIALLILPQRSFSLDDGISIDRDLGTFCIRIQTSPVQIYRYIKVHQQSLLVFHSF